MKKFLKINLIILMFGCIVMNFINVDAASKTGHSEFDKITFLYNPDAKLLVEMSNSELSSMMSKVKKKAFGWSTKSKYANLEVLYEAGSVFSRSNHTSQAIDFTYTTSEAKTTEFEITGSGTIALKASGKFDKISASLDNSIRLDIGVKNKIVKTEDMDFTIKILPGKKISLVVKGIATLSSGAAKYYFLGICTKKTYWEYIDVVNEYYELYEETLAY